MSPFILFISILNSTIGGKQSTTKEGNGCGANPSVNVKKEETGKSSASTNGATNDASVATPAVKVKKEKTETPNSAKTIHSLSSTSMNDATNGASVDTPAVVVKEEKNTTSPKPSKVEDVKAVVDEDEVVGNKGKRYMCSPLS